MNPQTNRLLQIESQRIKKHIIDSLESDDMSLFSWQENTMKISSILKGDSMKSIHTGLILDLFYTYLSLRKIANAEEIILRNFPVPKNYRCTFIKEIPENAIVQDAEMLHMNFLNSKYDYKNGTLKQVKSKENLIATGAVYTAPAIVHEIVMNTFSKIQKVNNKGFHVLDFACGTGRFYERIRTALSETYGISNEEAVLNHIYAVDVDADALNITRLKAISCIKELTEEKVLRVLKMIIVADALIKDNSYTEYALNENSLDGYWMGKFDMVVSNPPYLNLKPDRKKTDNTTSKKINEMVSYFRSSGQYVYAIQGMLNLYQLSIESMISMLKDGGELGIICPSTLFADMSCSRLRTFLLNDNTIDEIRFFPEDEKIFNNVTQATCIFYLRKGGSTKNISIKQGKSVFDVKMDLIKTAFPEKLEIPLIDEMEWAILNKISKFKTIKDFPFIRNKRGELDLTLYKRYITSKKTSNRLVRGIMLHKRGIREVNNEYVMPEFLNLKSEQYRKLDYGHKRLVCQQISNMSLKQRLFFVYSDPMDILGNSCNYISSDEETLKKLYLILNSSILNWRFKLTSSNNHINNYELADLPLPDLSTIDKDFEYKKQEELDSYIGKAFGLTCDEIKYLEDK